MPVIILRPRITNSNTEERPTQCPYCGNGVFQRWGQVTKPVKDMAGPDLDLYRYRCDDCQRTFRYYPKGIERSDYSKGTRQLAALVWAFGYSYRDISALFMDYEITLSRSMIGREGKALADRLHGLTLNQYRKVYSIDKVYIHRVSSKLGVVVAVELKSGRFAILGTLNEHDPRKVRSWLSPLVKDAEVDVIQLHTGILEKIHLPTDLNAGQLLA
jgi:transposase-like protein